ncbi:hypothetical protein E2C01_071444 [Portunus trituberculatus]|uniref:Uncharacterized protein n=1 Tax=Portunus trituberculatus TaxID=210409 RepID=A0A5B7I689_PORTR|nr:hypothetical protein [Portunus trituberculatus]
MHARRTGGHNGCHSSITPTSLSLSRTLLSMPRSLTVHHHHPTPLPLTCPSHSVAY